MKLKESWNENGMKYEWNENEYGNDMKLNWIEIEIEMN